LIRKLFIPVNQPPFVYKIKGDTIIIRYDGFTWSFAYKFKGNDILEMSDDGRTDLFYRKK